MPSCSKRGSRLALRRHIPAVRSPTLSIRFRIVFTVKRDGSERATSDHRQRRRDPRVGRRPHRVGARDRAVARVLAEVDEDAPPVGHAPGRRRHVLVVDPPLDLLRQRLREPPHLREGELRPDRRQHVQPGRAGGLRVRSEPEPVHDLLHDERDLAHELPRVAFARVEVDQQVVRPLDVLDARVPGVQLDAAEVDHPGERSGVVDDREDRRVPGRKLHELLADEVGVRRHALLVEEVAVDPVRVALHVERPAADVVQRARRDLEVVRDEVALRQPGLREEDLVRVRDRDLVAPDAHPASMKGPGHPGPRETERAGFEPATDLSARTRFPVALLRPLGHLSRCEQGSPCLN